MVVGQTPYVALWLLPCDDSNVVLGLSVEPGVTTSLGFGLKDDSSYKEVRYHYTDLGKPVLNVAGKQSSQGRGQNKGTRDTKVCRYWTQGTCYKGANCTYKHK